MSWLRPLVLQTPVTSSTQQAPSGHFLRPMSVASRQLAHRHMCTPGFLGSVCMHRLRWTADTAQIGISRSPGLYHHVGFRRKKKSDKKRESVLFPSIGVFAVTQNIAAARDKSSASPKCIAPAGRNTFSARSCSCSMDTGTSVPTTFQQCSFRGPCTLAARVPRECT